MRPRSGTLFLLPLVLLLAQPLFSQTYVNAGIVNYYWKYQQLGTCPTGPEGSDLNRFTSMITTIST